MLCERVRRRALPRTDVSGLARLRPTTTGSPASFFGSTAPNAVAVDKAAEK